MTRFEPTLIVTRLVIMRGRFSVYDEKFHAGLNVIRGENSSGKSTVLNAIFYGLGGDLTDWSDAVKICSQVILEVSLNGKVATLSRDISEKQGQPMEIFGGSYENSLKAPRSEWLKYPYRRSSSQESFSQALFRLLGIPEVVNEATGNLTMNQILRLLYSDQLSPIDRLFRFDNHFDQPLIRDSIGRLLSGAYDATIYRNEVELKRLTREFDAISGELKSLFSVLGRTGDSLNMAWLDSEQRSLSQEREKLLGEINSWEKKVSIGESKDQLSLKAQEDAYGAIQKIQIELGDLQERRNALAYEVADSTRFIQTLERKSRAIDDASIVAAEVGEIKFGQCPSCFAPVDHAYHEGVASCHLCKTPFDRERAKDRIVALLNDTNIQLKESRMLQTVRESEVDELDRKLAALREKWESSKLLWTSLRNSPTTDARSELRRLHQRAGYLERQIEDLGAKIPLVQLVDQLSARKDAINSQMESLKSENAKLYTSQERRLAHAKTLIAEQVKRLLSLDLARQDSFENPQQVDFDFGADKITVDGHSYFSASSLVILKNSFILGLLAAAMIDPHMRHPRFIMIDTTEDKGVEVERSHNFQNQMLRISKESKVEHQIIYATAMLSPDVESNEEDLIGRYSTRADYTLRLNS